MAACNGINPSFFDSDEDDDGPAIFKRSSSASKKEQLASAAKNFSPIQKQELPIEKLNKQREVVREEPLIYKPISESSSGLKSGLTISQSNGSTVSKDRSNGEVHSDSEEYDDNKPLITKLPLLSLRSAQRVISHVSKGVTSAVPKSSANSSTQEKRSVSEDSEDEIPLSAKFGFKSSSIPTIKKLESDDHKYPAPSKKLLQNGSIKQEPHDDLPLSAVKGMAKRPLEAVNNVSKSLSVKKVKSEPVQIKQEPRVKEETMFECENKKLSAEKKKAVSLEKPNKLTKVTSPATSDKTSKKLKKIEKSSQYAKSTTVVPGSGEGQKWTTLVHNGVIFPPPYKPHGVKMLYKGQPVDLTPEQEEVATMFAAMKDTDYATKEIFIENFMSDWKVLLGPKHVIRRFEECDFTPIYDWCQREKERKKQMTAEEKKALKEEKLRNEEKYMWAIVDDVKEKVGNFRVEPPGLFRGRGDHPKMGKLKRRILPSDITINIGKGAPIPECPIPGQRWKEIRHDNTVTWLAFWNDPINPREFKYVFLAASSALKGQSDKEKYEKARMLKDYIKDIRATYERDFFSKDITKRQIAVATYLIDVLALRAGNEKDEDEADTVGCCTLKVENVKTDTENVLEFDFLGKDSVRYQKTHPVKPAIYKAVVQFQAGKKGDDDLFDKLDTSKLNTHLKELMPGLTAKVFRTYNASITLDKMLYEDTKDADVQEKIKVYQFANREVALICNHQRNVSKSHDMQIARLDDKIAELRKGLEELQVDLNRAIKGKPPTKSSDGKPKRNFAPEALGKKIAQLSARINKHVIDKELKEENKNVALGTSKINYLDPRITVAWCKRHEVPIEKMFNKSLLSKFAWAMDVDPDFRF